MEWDHEIVAKLVASCMCYIQRFFRSKPGKGPGRGLEFPWEFWISSHQGKIKVRARFAASYI